MGRVSAFPNIDRQKALKMKLIIYLTVTSFIIITTKLSYGSDKLIPLSQVILEEQSLSRQLYVNERCAGLNQGIAGRFNNSSNKKGQKIAGALFLKAANHSMYAMAFANKMRKKYTQQEAISRSLLFAKIYQKEMDRIYDMTGNSIGGIVSKDQVVCNKIDADGGAIILADNIQKNNSKKTIKNNKNFFNETVQLAKAMPLKVSKTIKEKIIDEPNRCAITKTDQHENGFLSSKTLIVAFENNRPQFGIMGELAISKDKVLKPYLFLLKKLDKWFNTKQNYYAFFTDQVFGIKYFLAFFEDTSRYYKKIIDRKDLLVKDIPVMTFKNNETGKLYNVDLIFDKFEKFSNCFTRVSEENMKRHNESKNR